jgi:predicted transcriptional regulator of viral defense system
VTARSQVLGYRGQQVLAYVRETIAIDGCAPSYGMICDTVGLAHKGHVCRIVKSLEKRGLLHRVGAGRVRRIRLP